MATITVPAPKIMVGDRINGRTVRAVTGRKPQSATARYFNPYGGSKTGALRPLTFTGHVVTILFADDGPPMYRFGSETVEVERGAEIAEAA